MYVQRSGSPERRTMNSISYGNSVDCGQQFEDTLTQLITNQSLSEICDIGGGANPIFDPSFQETNRLNYTLLDISQAELDKAPKNYNKVCADITQPDKLTENTWDLVFSQALAEHVKDGKAFYENIYRILKPGGYAVHLFPTLYAFPFVANKLLPERLASWALDTLLPRDRYQHDKFPAYYSWCRGPARLAVERLENLGYEVVDYKGLFGHRYYQFWWLLQSVQDTYAKFLVKHPNSYHTSYVILILRKPDTLFNPTK